jgi:hypothetical protein
MKIGGKKVQIEERSGYLLKLGASNLHMACQSNKRGF